ncbi:hypothetical protein MGG_15854 [Pyricularia oryzae 70-15]|uniref:Uncharacterized protein n=3 Tax=Pyricularia oryzae TaxID=318829 RepID=G4MSQ9_PYRO7|nr:uncharacterized protein MGG_15854 [Pyricularia oryzae 70-15]EHA55480.1 hypothetical protein MGG_15854 [Pyricularia oryzae 70-15]ELQ35431.1 hypothetical protein OOU_Y34scaffold00707g15 [Pyricularia oryzae Y34]
MDVDSCEWRPPRTRGFAVRDAVRACNVEARLAICTERYPLPQMPRKRFDSKHSKGLKHGE